MLLSHFLGVYEIIFLSAVMVWVPWIYVSFVIETFGIEVHN